MPDTRRNRGAHPEDHGLFGADQLPTLRRAAHDLSWLLDAGYALDASLSLVGDRFALRDRQRLALKRSICSHTAREQRAAKYVAVADLAGEQVAIDGFNLLTSIEAALAGGLTMRGRDGNRRDMASMHGSWRRVAQTEPAIELALEFCAQCQLAGGIWYLDQPVSNSGRLASMLRERLSGSWDVEVCIDVDARLWVSPLIVVTADAGILDRCQRACPLAESILSQRIPEAWCLDWHWD